MKMESNQIMMKEKLEFFGIIKEALSIPTKNPRFIILTLITSFPLFCSLLFHEVVFQQTLVETIKILTYVPPPPAPRHGSMIIVYSCYGCRTLDVIKKLFEEVSQRFFLYGILYLGIVHLLDLLNTITTVYSASVLYSGEQMNLKEMLCRPIKKVGFKGPLVTSIYALVLASLTIIGLLSLASNSYMSLTLFMVIFGVPFIALFTKYIEWSAIWNTGIVISILEEKHGVVALGVSAYISRGRRKHGFLLMLVFFVWRIVLRLSYLYLWWQKRGSGGVVVIVTIGQVCLVCLENVMKWLAFMVYFYDCKKRFLEKKIDVEEGRAAAK